MLPKLREAIDLTYTGLTPELCVTVDELRNTLKEYRFHTILTEGSIESISDHILATEDRQENIIEFVGMFSACIHLTGLTDKDLDTTLSVCGGNPGMGSNNTFIPPSYFNAVYNSDARNTVNIGTRFNLVLRVFILLHHYLPAPHEK